MTLLKDNCIVLGLVLSIAIFYSFSEASPVTIGNKEATTVQNDVHLQMKNNVGMVPPDPKSVEMDAFKTSVAQAARMANGKYPDTEVFFSDIERFEGDPRKQPDRSGYVDFLSLPLAKDEHVLPNMGPLGKDDNVFSFELDILRPESRNSVSLHDEKQADRTGATDFGDPPLQREQHALRNVEQIGNDYGASNLEQLVESFWPQSEISVLTIEGKQADQNIATLIDDKPLSREHRAAPIFEPLSNDDRAFDLEQMFDMFWLQPEKTNSVHHESRASPNGAVNYVDQTLLRGQGSAPNIEARNTHVDMIDREMQDTWWPQPWKFGFKEEQANQGRAINFADPPLLGDLESALKIKPRETQEGETETTPNPHKPADITYESNMLYYFVTVTLPAFIGISLAILLCCFCMRINGCCCRLFDERPPYILEQDVEDIGEDNRVFKKGQLV